MLEYHTLGLMDTTKDLVVRSAQSRVRGHNQMSKSIIKGPIAQSRVGMCMGQLWLVYTFHWTALVQGSKSTIKAHKRTIKAHKSTIKAHKSTIKAHKSTIKGHKSTIKGPRVQSKVQEHNQGSQEHN